MCHAPGLATRCELGQLAVRGRTRGGGEAVRGVLIVKQAGCQPAIQPTASRRYGARRRTAEGAPTVPGSEQVSGGSRQPEPEWWARVGSWASAQWSGLSRPGQSGGGPPQSKTLARSRGAGGNHYRRRAEDAAQSGRAGLGWCRATRIGRALRVGTTRGPGERHAVAGCANSNAGGLPARDTADCQSALRGAAASCARCRRSVWECGGKRKAAGHYSGRLKQQHLNFSVGALLPTKTV